MDSKHPLVLITKENDDQSIHSACSQRSLGEGEVKRELKQRHISMIAIGGT